MSSLFAELKRRNVFKVAIAYVVAAWLVLQISDVVLGNIDAPAWVFKVVMLLMALGLPFALIMAWAFQMTPEGLIRDGKVSGVAAQPGGAGEKLSATVEAVSTRPPADEKSIAVLPFVNMSDQLSNEYFSDGISEELLNLLSKIPELRVAARISSFSLKGKELQIAQVGTILNVAYILEGSVRKAGNQVRITAQLIKVNDGYHLWSENYDRTLDNIFAVQDEIAMAVVEQLKLKLLGKVPTTNETDPQAYAFFLKGQHLARQGTAEAWDQAIAMYQKVLAIAPTYAAAWAGLGNVYSRQTTKGLRPFGTGYALARDAAQKALALDKDNARAHTTLGWIAMAGTDDLQIAIRYFDRALELEPANLDILGYQADIAGNLGRHDEAIAILEYIAAYDPVNPDVHHDLGRQYIWARRLDESIASNRTALRLSPGRVSTNWAIGLALVLKGEFAAALEAMQQEPNTGWRMNGLTMVYHALGRTAESDAALQELIRTEEQAAAYNIAYLYAFRGEADMAFAWLDKAVQYKDSGIMELPSQPLFENIRSDPRWGPFVQGIGKSKEQLARIEFKAKLPS
ncbi:MAG: tetratricopeptide repeat protein [Gammaproteobacteria bacterium]|nr:tetratricopeptide repeat protein [Gammaproteobacteria bacterium]